MTLDNDPEQTTISELMADIGAPARQSCRRGRLGFAMTDPKSRDRAGKKSR